MTNFFKSIRLLMIAIGVISWQLIQWTFFSLYLIDNVSGFVKTGEVFLPLEIISFAASICSIVVTLIVLANNIELIWKLINKGKDSKLLKEEIW